MIKKGKTKSCEGQYEKYTQFIKLFFASCCKEFKTRYTENKRMPLPEALISSGACNYTHFELYCF